MPRYKYIDEFRPIADEHPMLSFLFPSSRQITSSLGALNGANIGLSEACSDRVQELTAASTLCLVLGDGRDPRTAIVAAIQHGWSVVAIDEELDEKWEDPKGLLPKGCRFLGFQGDMSGFLPEGYELVKSSLCPIEEIQHLVIICVEQGGDFNQLKSLRGRLGVTDLRVLYNSVPATVVSVSSDEIHQDCPWKTPPFHSFLDEEILSSNRRVQVWSIQGSRRSPHIRFNASVPTKSGPRIGVEEKVSKSTSFVPKTPSKRPANSKVAQLQRQQELASQKRTELSSKPKHERTPSATITDDTSDSSSKADNKESRSKDSTTPSSNSLTGIIRRRRLTSTAKKNKITSTNRSKSEGNVDESSVSLLSTESKDTIKSIMSLHNSPQKEIKIDSSLLLSDTPSPPPVNDVLLHFTGVVPPSCMPRSTSERQARIQELSSTDNPIDPLRTMKRDVSAASSKTDSTTASSLHGDDFDLPSRSASDSSVAQHEYKPGDFVEVKVGNIYQAGTIDKQLFKGVYNVTLFSDTPAWNDKRSHIDMYQHSPQCMPEVLARDIRPFVPAPPGEVIYVFVNGNERKCCVHGYSYSDSEDLTSKQMKYVVKFAKKDGEWRSEKHRVPVQRAYRMLFEL